jgi:predicted ATPase/DNA-binding winged helix-turn-helix (wHTH) protein
VKTSVAGTSTSFAFGPFTLVPSRQMLLRAGAPVRIGGRALDLLTALVERPGEVVTKAELLARVWPDTAVDETNLKVNMASLRRVLSDGPETPFIATVVGRGYRFVAPVRPSGAIELPSAASKPAAIAHNLPIATARIYGRAEVITAIRRDLDQARLVSIVGAGGVGKTTVAVAVAEQVLDGFGDGVWLVDLATLSDGERTAHAIAATLGVQAHTADMLAVVCAFLRDRQTLLVLDNCEHVIDGAAACIDRILAGAAGVRVLTTSREPLRMAGERVRRLPGLDTPPDSGPVLDAPHALEFPAVQLFVERVTEGHAEFQLTDADAPIVAQICRSLDGLALAIELAATRAGAFGVAGLLRQLDDRLRLSGRRAGPERQRTLAATLDWSYALLDDREAAVLRAIAVFAGGFDLDGAVAVAAGFPADVLEVLASLSAKSLLVLAPAGDGVTGRLLETTRAYALARLRSSGEEPDVRRRHAEHVGAVLERAKREWARRSAREWGASYAPLVDDLRSALAWADADAANPSLFIRLAVTGSALWNHLSLTEECRAAAARAIDHLDAARLTGTATEMELQMALAGATLYTRGPSAASRAALRRTLELAERVGDVDHRLRSLRTLGSHQSFSGEIAAAIQTLETFVAVAAEHDPAAVPDGETHLGICELHAGRLETARRRLERLYQRRPVTLDDARLARFLYDRTVDVGNVLSYAQFLTGYPDAAARTAVATVEQALAVKHGLSLSNALAVAACPVFFLSRRYAECERYAAMLDDHVHRHGIVIWSPTARFFRAALACAGPVVPSRGIEDLEQAVAEYRAINHLSRQAWILAVLADALVRSGRVAEAASTIGDAIARGRATGELWCMPEVLRIQASVLDAQDRAAAAEAVLVDAIAMARDLGGRSWQLRAAYDLARRWAAGSRTADARALLSPIYAEFTEGFATPDLVAAAELIAACSEAGKARLNAVKPDG